jgi:hypothetical protein
VLDDLRHPEALRFIAECEHRRVPILGFEWFRRDGETVIPVGIADFSTAPPETTWEEARRLLGDGIPDGADTVEFVTGDPLT